MDSLRLRLDRVLPPVAVILARMSFPERIKLLSSLSVSIRSACASEPGVDRSTLCSRVAAERGESMETVEHALVYSAYRGVVLVLSGGAVVPA